MALHVVLVEPEIPPNTGNIVRTCAVTESVLHLIEPLGFDVNEKSIRRAGLDYWDHVDIRRHKSLIEFLEEYGNRRMILSTTKANKLYTDIEYQDEDMLVFGKETAGLPSEFIEANRELAVRIPMGNMESLRSLNLSNSVSVVLYEALRQLNFICLQ